MNTDAVTAPMRIVVVATPQEDPRRVLSVARGFQEHSCFKAAIAGCIARSSIETFTPFPGMATGIGRPMAAKRDPNAMHERCEQIAKALAALPEKERLPLTCAEGSFYQVAAALSTAFDLVVVPRAFEFPDVLGLWFPDFDTHLALLGPAPTLFCATPSNWQSIVIVQTGDQACWWAMEILTRMRNQLDTTLHQWFPSKLNKLKPQLSGDQDLMRLFSRDAVPQLDISAIPEQQQVDICLVVSAAVVRSVFRFCRVRRILRGWQGSCLVWP